jgi:hypothetical protein
MRMPVSRKASVFLICVLASGCVPAKDQSSSAALYNLPVKSQKDYFMALSAEKQVDVVISSFDRKQAWDMRLLDWLSASKGEVAAVVKGRVADETDDWHLTSLALAIEHLSLQHSCRMAGDEAHMLLVEISEKLEQPTSKRIVEEALARHDKDHCPVSR